MTAPSSLTTVPPPSIPRLPGAVSPTMKTLVVVVSAAPPPVTTIPPKPPGLAASCAPVAPVTVSVESGPMTVVPSGPVTSMNALPPTVFSETSKPA